MKDADLSADTCQVQVYKVQCKWRPFTFKLKARNWDFLHFCFALEILSLSTARRLNGLHPCKRWACVCLLVTKAAMRSFLKKNPLSDQFQLATANNHCPAGRQMHIFLLQVKVTKLLLTGPCPCVTGLTYWVHQKLCPSTLISVCLLFFYCLCKQMHLLHCVSRKCTNAWRRVCFYIASTFTT